MDSSKKSKKSLKSIPTSKLARGAKLTGLTASVGIASMGARIAQAFAGKAVAQAQNTLHQVEQARKIVAALSELKGAAMKLGQMMSLHAQHLFPREVADILARLQASSDFMEFPEIDKVLKAELGKDYRKELLDFSEEPIASASIGQVHKACLKDGTWVAVKVQYPGVDQSIDSDVDSLAGLLRIVAKIPSADSFNDTIAEIKELLKQETDYVSEAKNLEYFRKLFAGTDGVKIPRVISKYSTKRVLMTELVRGLSVQEFNDSGATQEQRNQIGQTFLRVFNEELFRLGAVQTDPNFGNYKILPDTQQLLLLDFGAVKYFDDGWRRRYLQMVRASFDRDSKKVIRVSEELGFLRPDDTEEVRAVHLELCEMFLEPFRTEGEYDFGKSDLPERMRAMLPRIIGAFKFRAPPRNILFLNRKMVGTYFFLSAIKAKVNVRPLLEEYLLN